MAGTPVAVNRINIPSSVRDFVTFIEKTMKQFRACLQVTEAHDADSRAESRFVHEGGAFVAQTQAAKAFEPSEGVFDHVSIHTPCRTCAGD